MARKSLDEVRALVAMSESPRVEFKQFEKLEGHEKNVLCCEIAAMANAGGGSILVGVDDGTPGVPSGCSTDVARVLAEVGWVQKLLRERVAPQPEVDVYALALSDHRAVVVLDVEPPHLASMPVFSPVLLTRDVQGSDGRLRYGKGTVVVRDHTECRVVVDQRMWDRVMAPILDRFQEARMARLLRAFVAQDLVDRSKLHSRTEEFATRVPDFDVQAAELQARVPSAARYDTRVLLDGVGHLSYERQRELLEAASVYHRGWAFPTVHRPWMREEGRLVHRLNGPEQESFWGPPKGVYQEFWIFTPDGAFGSSMLDRIDLHPDFNGVKFAPPGPERPLDSVVVAWHVVEFVEFVRKISVDADASRVWASFVLANALNRPMAAFTTQGRDVDRMQEAGRWRSNLATIAVEAEFEVDALRVGWRDVAVEWGTEVLSKLGMAVQPEAVRRVQDDLLHLKKSWNSGPAPSR